jgi:hypothetical protein
MKFSKGMPKLKFHPMKLSFLFIILILGIWLASTTFGKYIEGNSDSAEEMMAAAKKAVAQKKATMPKVPAYHPPAKGNPEPSLSGKKY